MKTYKIAFLSLLGLNLPAFGMIQMAKQEIARQAIPLAQATQRFVQSHAKK